MALFSVLDGYYGNCSYCLGYGRLYKKVERKRAPILFWLKVNEVSYFCDECDSKVNKKESKLRKLKENEVLGVDPRAYSNEHITACEPLPVISRRALRRVRDRLEPPKKCDCCDSPAVSIKNNSVIYGKEYGD